MSPNSLRVTVDMCIVYHLVHSVYVGCRMVLVTVGDIFCGYYNNHQAGSISSVRPTELNITGVAIWLPF